MQTADMSLQLNFSDSGTNSTGTSPPNQNRWPSSFTADWPVADSFEHPQPKVQSSLSSFSRHVCPVSSKG